MIRQQARDKNLDPALIAAVIYRESKFRDVTSDAGAKGYMQILPGTAQFQLLPMPLDVVVLPRLVSTSPRSKQ